MQLTPSALWQRDPIELFLLTPDLVTDDYVAWLNDPQINRYLESRFATHTLQDTQRFVRDCLASDDSLMLGIRSQRLGGRHVGNIKIGPINRTHGLGEIGLLIGDRDCWGQGIARRAIAAICDIARDELGLRKVTAGCYAGNVGSQKAFENAGFSIEGVRPRHVLLDGVETDVILMGRLLQDSTPAR